MTDTSTQAAIKAEILQSLGAIAGGIPCTFQLAALNKGKGGKSYLTYGYFNDWKRLADEAHRLTTDKNVQSVYVNLQDIHPDCIARAENKMLDSAKAVSAGDVLCYRHFLIDIDRNGIKDISSSDNEKEQIRLVVEEIREFVQGDLNWPDPAFYGDSGNAYHLDFAVSLPANAETQALFKRCYQALNQMFGGDGIAIDASLADPNQLIKLYGTMQRKGDNTQARPWRWSKLLATYDTTPVTIEQLKALADRYQAPQSATTQTTTKTDSTKDLWWLAKTPEAVEKWAEDAEIKLGPRTAEGNGYKWSVECMTSTEHKDGAALILNNNGYLKYKCHHASCADKTVSDILAKHPAPIKKRSDSEKDTQETTNGEILNRYELWMDTLRSLGRTFKLNVLEDMVEVDGKRLDDIMRSRLYLEMASKGVNKTYADDCINVLASEKTYHPVQDYLNSLKPDGKNHLGLMLGHITGDGKTVEYSTGKQPLHAALITRWLLGCVARALDGDKEHAFKHQTPMLVFVGHQGIGKSSWVRWLVSGIGYEFHRESALDPHHPDHVRSAVTKWIWEVSELGASLRKGDRDALKGFITQEWHTYRKPWGKANITKPTLANFVGTVNPEIGFLDDPTGHRRFLPIHITKIDRDYQNAVDVNQMWAQVVHLYKNGESPELSAPERSAVQAAYTEHEVENPLQTYVQMYFDLDKDDHTKKAFTAEIMNRLRLFGVSISNNPKVAGRELNDALAPLGLKRELMSIAGIKGWGWRGIEPNKMQPPKP